MKKIKILLCILAALSLQVGCRRSEFDANYRQFNESYILATDFLENSNDYLKELNNINIDNVEKELKKMKEFIDKMSIDSKSKNEKRLLENVTSYYQEVKYLLYAAQNYNKLTVEEKRKVYIMADLATLNRDSIKRGDE